MEAAMATAWSRPGSFQRIPKRQIPLTTHEKWFLFSNIKYRQLPLSCAIKLPTAENFGDPEKARTYLSSLSKSLSKSLPEPVKEFPWKKAENMLVDRLLVLGKETLKWFLAAFFITTLISDIILTFSRNKELLIPPALFVGVAIADFHKETYQELLQRVQKDWTMEKHLLTIGSIFVTIRFIMPGKIFLNHVCSGGLMQVLWLLMSSRGTEVNSGFDQPAAPSEDEKATRGTQNVQN